MYRVIIEIDELFSWKCNFFSYKYNFGIFKVGMCAFCDILCFVFVFQFVILVIDSTDRERLHISKEELYHMLANEVGAYFTIYISNFFFFFFFFLQGCKFSGNFLKSGCHEV